jgi:hypothetical protein
MSSSFRPLLYYEYLYTLEPDERGVTRNLKNRRNAMRRGLEQELRRVGLLKEEGNRKK